MNGQLLNAKEKPKFKKDFINKIRSQKIYSCKYCESEYTQKTNLYRHIRRLHKPRGDLPKALVDKYKCKSCVEEFSKQSLLAFHEALLHPTRKGKLAITCPTCPFSGSKSDLLGHYVAQHNIKIDLEEQNFPSALEFYVWKCNVERNTLTQYAKRQKHHVLVNGIVIDMLYCHRDGFYKPEGKNIRNLKIKGTNKINGYCPAFMKVMTYADDRVTVLFLKTHVGHDCELDRLALTREERDSIAAKIAIGISFDDILTELHSSKHERLRIMTRKDLYNIETSYNLNSVSVRGRNAKLEDVQELHSAALEMSHSFLSIEEDHWYVKSTSKNDVMFKVELTDNDCDYTKCILKCSHCECCGHHYICSCSDGLKMAMCKHKHFVHMSRKDPQMLMQDQVVASSEPISPNTSLESTIILDNCPQLTTLVLQDIPSTISNEDTAIFVPTDINVRKATIRTQLAGILQAAEASDLEEELHLIQSLLEPVVQTVQSIKGSDNIVVQDPSGVQPVCKQLRLDDDTQYFATTSADTDSPLLAAASQLQSTIVDVDEHNNPILITYTINEPSQ